ncbi:MAG: hypothetical protein CSB24_02730 [Deltaproteobacteria bacterium]|nr:MAG: hypothetical protein CSB24_02730 [Deltaproteobacteria bacterium]
MTHQVSIPAESRVIACPGCDLLLALDCSIETRFSQVCPRCSQTIYRIKPKSVNKVLALAITGLLIYFPAVFSPLLSMEKLGMKGHGNVVSSAVSLYQGGYYLAAAVVFLAAVLLPFLLLFLIFWVSLNIRAGRKSAMLRKMFSAYLHLQEWGMTEVYFLGIIITIIKMNPKATIYYDTGFFCFLALVIISVGILAALDKRLFWTMLEPDDSAALSITDLHDAKGKSALQLGLAACRICGKLQPETGGRCSCCNSILHARIPASLSKTWALVITSAMFFIPANILPIMQVDLLGVPGSSTIMDGIIFFFEHGNYPIGLIIFTASVLVPLFKVAGLMIILFTVHSRRRRFLRQKAGLFRFIEFIGRWSMLDIFVIALLTVLVDFGFFTSVYAAPAATYFCLVVVFTMLAALVFDPRIMWDRCYQLKQ